VPELPVRRCLTCSRDIRIESDGNCPPCGEGDPFGRLSRPRAPKKASQEPTSNRVAKWGLWLVLAFAGLTMLSVLVEPEPRPRTRSTSTPAPGVPLSTYETIREFDDVTLISAEQYRQMFRVYAQQCARPRRTR